MMFRDQPLLRLLAVNVVIGAGVAVLMVGGLVFINPFGLRDLMLATARPRPRSPCCCSGSSSRSAAPPWAARS